jgi:hypothetical protein
LVLPLLELDVELGTGIGGRMKVEVEDAASIGCSLDFVAEFLLLNLGILLPENLGRVFY